MPKRCDIPPERWDNAANLFELGFKNGKQIAGELGVSPQTVMREMQRRGARKGWRVRETVVGLEAALDRKHERQAELRAQIEIQTLQRHATLFAVLDEMMAAIEHAAAKGDVTLAGSTIDHAAMALGVPNRPKARGPC